MQWREKLRGFYAIVDKPDKDLASLLVRGGANVVQLRQKGSADRPEPSTRQLIDAARALRALTRELGVLLIVNDRIDVALLAEADGVHLGQDDLSAADAVALRSRVGADLLLGISTHNPDQVRAAVAVGADYLGYGPVFATATKANPDPVQGPEALARAVGLAAPTPVVAIGGITPDNVGEVVAAGAHAACSIGAVNASADPAAAASAITAAFSAAT